MKYNHVRWLLAAWTCVLAPVAAAEVIRTEDDTTVTWTINVEQIDWSQVEVEGTKFLKPTLKGVDGYEGVDFNVGRPALPVIRLYIDGLVAVTEGPSVYKMLEANLPVVPNLPSVIKRPGEKRALIVDKAAYANNSFIAKTNADMVPAGSIRGIPRELLTLYPIDLNPATGEVRETRSFVVKMRKPTPVEEGAVPTIAFVVGQALEASPALAEYEAFKRTQGYNVAHIVYGRDVNSADAIRAKLKELLMTQNLRHAVLVGDSDTIPAKSATHMSGPTDHYYRAIDTANYETDINGPDIGVGRMSARTEAQLRGIVDKYLRYQTQALTADPWEMGVSFAATSDGSFYQVAEATHEYVIETYTREKGYYGTFPQVRTLGGDKLYAITHRASGTNLQTALQAGRNFVTYSGHGYTGGWAEPALDANGVRSLTDPTFMPFVLGFACDTGDYRGTESYAETWQRHPNGAILYLGSVDSSLWDEDDIMERRLFDGVFAGRREFGDIVNNSLSEVWRQYGGAGYSKYYWESYTTFADPSVSLRTGLPN